jgi:hypothetical protein
MTNHMISQVAKSYDLAIVRFVTSLLCHDRGQEPLYCHCIVYLVPLHSSPLALHSLATSLLGSTPVTRHSPDRVPLILT